MHILAGFVYEIDREIDTIWIHLVDEDGINMDYECSFDIVIDEHRDLLKEGTYIHLIEDAETGRCIIAMDEPSRWTQEEIDEAQKRADALYKALRWD